MPIPLYTCFFKNIGFVFDLFYGISTIVGYLTPNPFIHIHLIHRICLSWVLWPINHCRLFNNKSS